METDADPQPYISEPCRREGVRILGARWVEDTTRKLTESTNLNLQGLTETEPTTREPA